VLSGAHSLRAETRKVEPDCTDRAERTRIVESNNRSEGNFLRGFLGFRCEGAFVNACPPRLPPALSTRASPLPLFRVLLQISFAEPDLLVSFICFVFFPLFNVNVKSSSASPQFHFLKSLACRFRAPTISWFVRSFDETGKLQRNRK